jgi:hypothetical protein
MNPDFAFYSTGCFFSSFEKADCQTGITFREVIQAVAIGEAI